MADINQALNGSWSDPSHMAPFYQLPCQYTRHTELVSSGRPRSQVFLLRVCIPPKTPEVVGFNIEPQNVRQQKGNMSS